MPVPHEGRRDRDSENTRDRTGVQERDVTSELSRSAGTDCQHCCDPRTNIDTEHSFFALGGRLWGGAYAASVPTKFPNDLVASCAAVEHCAGESTHGRTADCTICNMRGQPRVYS